MHPLSFCCFKTPRREQLKYLKPQFGHSRGPRRWANVHKVSVLLVVWMLSENKGLFTAKQSYKQERINRPVGKPGF